MNSLVRELDRRLLHDHDITFVQAMTLMSIASFETPQPHMVAEALSQQSQTVTGVLDRLERAGHVRRLRDMDDRRAVRLQLTASGERLAVEVVKGMEGHGAGMFSPATDGTLRELAGGLVALHTSLEAAAPT